MDVICSQCNATYSIADHKIPSQPATATCKRCDGRIVINAAASDPPFTMGQGSAPPAAATSAPDNAMSSAFPQIATYASAKYAFAELLKPTKKGNYKTRINKYKMKILASVKPVLERLLDSDEQVMRISGGTAYYPIEILFGNGALTMIYNRYAVVATNKRLVMINTNHKMTKPTHYLFQIAYNEIKKVSRGLFRSSLSLSRKKGKRRIFTSMKPSMTKEMKDFITQKMVPGKTLQVVATPKEYLCPSCFAGLGKKLAKCSVCSAVFKTPMKAALRSLFIPGWGDLYLGHRFLGCVELLVSLFIWSIALSFFLGGVPDEIGIGVVLLLFYNGFDALLTYHMAKKGYSLEKKQPAMAANPRLAVGNA